jgi:hypothetical protein
MYLKIVPFIFQFVDSEFSVHQECEYFTVQTQSSRSKNQSNWLVHLVTPIWNIRMHQDLTYAFKSQQSSHCSVWNKNRFGWKPSDMIIPRWCIDTHLASIEPDTCGRLSWQEGDGAITQNQDNKQQIGSLSSSCRTLLKTCVTAKVVDSHTHNCD